MGSIKSHFNNIEEKSVLEKEEKDIAVKKINVKIVLASIS